MMREERKGERERENGKERKEKRKKVSRRLEGRRRRRGERILFSLFFFFFPFRPEATGGARGRDLFQPPTGQKHGLKSQTFCSST